MLVGIGRPNPTARELRLFAASLGLVTFVAVAAAKEPGPLDLKNYTRNQATFRILSVELKLRQMARSRSAALIRGRVLARD